MIRIGIIDSGLGGLTVLKACLDRQIFAEYVYLYDNKFHPYGGRNKEELTAITFLNIEKLTSIGCEIVVLACNTATSACVDDMRRTFFIPIIGTEPPIKVACEECSSIALLATPYTVKSERVKRILNAFPQVKIVYPDCSGIATAVEFGYDSPIFLKEKLSSVLICYGKVDGVVLGCTHYTFAKNIIADILPNSKIYEPSQGVARRLESKLDGYLTFGENSIIHIRATADKLSEKHKNFINNYLGKVNTIYD